MTAHSQPSSTRKETRKETRTPSPKPTSPTLAQFIAEAWKRESAESQERWRKKDQDVKQRYTAGRRKSVKTKM